MERDKRRYNEAPSGNASNPAPDRNPLQNDAPHQLIDQKGEKYLRESGNIEDMPDAEEEYSSEEDI